jgi:cobalamin biosynthesis protein CobT
LNEGRFKVEPRLRSYARLITQNFLLRVLFQGEVACIGDGWMQIPPVQETQEGLDRAKYLVAHESGHDIFSQLDAKEKAEKIDKRLPHILNALEDARVEKLMISRFEGLEDNMRVNIQKIVSKWDKGMPIASQLLGGMFLVGRGFDIEMLSDDVQKILGWLEPLISQASEASDSQQVLEISKEVLKKIDHLLKDVEDTSTPKLSGKTKKGISNSDFQCKDMSDFIKEHFDEVKLPPDYDDMESMEQLKDENQQEDESITRPDDGNISEYNSILMPLRRELNFLVCNLRNLVDKKHQNKRRRSFIHNTKQGVIESRRLWKLCSGRDDVFMQRRVEVSREMDVDPDSLAIYLLVDESHSMMESDRYLRAREAVIIVCEALDSLGIAFALTGYTAGGKLSRIIYKEFHERYTDVKTGLISIGHRVGTLTAEHIPFAIRRLVKRDERKKILIVLTDATEIESPLRLRNAILDAEEVGVEMIGIGINTNLMSDYFRTFIEITDMSDFARQMLEMMKRMILDT